MTKTLNNMSDKAKYEASRSLNKIDFVPTEDAVNSKFEERGGRIPGSGGTGRAVGFYNGAEKLMCVDGGRGQDTHQTSYSIEDYMAHIYAHELGHAIDKPNGGYRTGVSKSDTARWEKAWEKDINRTSQPLSGYARTNKAEGFAEFHRIVVFNPAVAKSEFPNAWKFFEMKGLTK
jgi:hypothetical protein